MIAIMPRPRSRGQPGLKGSDSAAFSARRSRFRNGVQFGDMNLFLLGFEFRDQNIQAFDTALIGDPRGQAPIVSYLLVDLLAFPTHRRIQPAWTNPSRVLTFQADRRIGSSAGASCLFGFEAA